MYITLRLELQYQGDKARKMNHDRDPGHRVLPWSPYDPTRNKLPEGAFSWRKMLDNDLKILEFGHPETVNYVKQSAKIFCNYSVEENGVGISRCTAVVAKNKLMECSPSIDHYVRGSFSSRSRLCEGSRNKSVCKIPVVTIWGWDERELIS